MISSLFSRVNVRVAGLLAVAAFGVLGLAPRMTGQTKAETCPNPPSVATLNPYPVSESGTGCTDYPVIAISNPSVGMWQSSTSANIGDELLVRVYVHNGAAQNLDPNETTARNVRIQSSVGQGSVSVSVTSDNTNSLSGTAYVNLPSGASLEVVPGSGEVYDWQLNVVQSGVSPSYVSLGDMTACFEYSKFLRFRVRVVGPAQQPATGTISGYVSGQVSGQCLLHGYISWSTQNTDSVQVTVKELPNGAEQVYSGELNASNADAPWISPNTQYLFTLYDTRNGQRVKLSETTLTGSNLSCGPTEPTGTISGFVSGQVSGQCLLHGYVSWSTQNTPQAVVTVRELPSGTETDFSYETSDTNADAPWISPNTQYRFTLYAVSGGQRVKLSETTLTGSNLSCGPTVEDVICSPSTQSAQVGQTVYFSASRGDGQYSWSAPSGNPGSGYGISFSTAYGSAGTKTVTVSSAGKTASCSVVVSPVEIPDVQCNPGTQTVDPNQPAYFTATGGDGQYSWSAPSANPGSGFGVAFSTTYGTSGSKTVTVSSAGKTASCSVSVRDLPPQQKNFTLVTDQNFCVGQNTRYTITGTANLVGKPIYWSSTKNGVPTGENNTYVGHTTSDAQGLAFWTDIGSTWTQEQIGNWTKTATIDGIAKTVSFTVRNCGTPTQDVICSPSTQSAQVGQTVYFSASRGDGQYSWSAPSGNPGSGYGISFSTAYGSAGTKTVTVSSAGKTASCSVTVTEQPTQNLVCAPTVQSVQVQQNVYFTATGGNGQYFWSAPGANQPAGSGSSYYTAYGSAGTKTVTVTSGGQSATCTVYVSQQPTQDVICSPSTQSAQVGQTVYFSASRGDGQYSWSASSGNPGSGYGTSFSTTYGTSGSKTVTVSSAGKTASCNVTITEQPTQDVICSPSTQTAQTGQIVYFSASRGNGQYSWQASSGNPGSGYGMSFWTVFGSAGTKTVTVSSAGKTATCAVTVNEVQPNDVICSPGNQTVDQNQPVYFTAIQGNGQYSWSAPSGNPGSGQGQSFSTTYGTSGTKAVTVTSAGRTATCSVYVRPSQPVCTPNSGVTLTNGAITESSSGIYQTTVSWTFSGQNPMRVTYVDPADGTEKTFASNVTSGGSQQFVGFLPNRNYIFRIYDLSSCGGVMATLVIRKDVSTQCVANTNVTFTATQPVKSGSTYTATLNWSSSGSHGVKLTQGNLTSVVHSGSSSGSYTVSGMQAGNSYTFYLHDSECNTLLSAITVVVPQEGTGGGSYYYNYQSCLYNSCNTTYIYNNQTVPANDYRQLSVTKMVRNLGGSFQNSVSAGTNETVEFEIRVRSSGNQTVSNVRVWDNLPSGLSFVSGSVRIDGSYASDSFGSSNQIYLGSLTVGQEKRITFQARVSSGYGSSLQNTAYASGDSAGQVQDDAWVFTQGQVQGGSVNLQYSKRAMNETKNQDATSVVASKEDFITYTLTVNNTGSSPATGFVITDDLSQVLPYADMVDLGGGSLSGNVISYPGITVPAGGSVSRSFKVRIKYFLADNLSYVMTNTYGNTLTVRINTPQIKGAFVAPKTGANTIALSFGGISTAVFALFRRRKDILKFILNEA